MNQTSNTKRNVKVIKMAGMALTMQVLLYLIALSSVAGRNLPSYFWQLSNSSLFIGLLTVFCLLLFGLFSRKAYQLHLIFSALPITWVVPFLVAGYELGSKNLFPFIFIVTMCLVSILNGYAITLRTLNSKEKPVVQSGRLELSTGYWDLDKYLYIEKNKTTKEIFARFVLPLGSILGVLLYRNFPAHTQILYIVTDFLLATILISGTGIHFAAAMYIKSTQKVNELDIHV